MSNYPLVPLKRLVQGPGAYGLNISADEYCTSGIRFLRTTDVAEDGSLNEHADAKYIPEKLANGYRLRDGDVLFSRSGTVGRAFQFSDSAHEASAYAGYLVRFRPKETKLNSRFLFYASRSSLFQGQITADAIQTTIVNYNAERYGNTLVPAPNIERQRAIADFLDRKTAAIDALIRKKEKLIHLLEEKRAALINQAVTKGLDPNVPMKDSGIPWIGQIPAHWRCVRLRHVLWKLEQGWSPLCLSRPPEDGEWGVMKTGCVNTWTFDPSESKALPPDLEPRLEYLLGPGDVLMSRASGSAKHVGAVGIVTPHPQRLLLCDKLYRIKLISSQASSDFFVFAMRSTYSRRIIDSAATGQSTLRNISQDFLRDFPLPLPGIDEQREIARTLSSRIEEDALVIQKMERQIRALKEYRSSIITSAVNGSLAVG